MSVRTATALSNIFLALSFLGLSQAEQQPLPIRTASAESSIDALPKALHRIQRELKQIAEDINSVDARMFLESHNGREQTGSTAPRIHELLKNDDPAALIRDFLSASQDRLRFESCLKSGKLYRNLAAEFFTTRKTPTGSSQATSQPALGDEFIQTAQLFFLSRMIPEFEVHYGALQSQAKATPDAERTEPWQKLGEALRHDDQLLLARLSGILVSAGESPNRFALRVLSQSQKISPSAPETIVEGMAVLNAAADMWKLNEIPGINPVFLGTLECESRAMNSVPLAGFKAALLQAFNCRASTDGSSVRAFTALSPPPEARSKVPLAHPTEIPQGRDIFRLPTQKELQDLQNQDSKGDTVPTVPSQPPGFGVSNTPVKRPKIPSWWIRCACPSDHPDAGIVFEGVRWHAPVLQCPNPELRRLEVK